MQPDDRPTLNAPDDDPYLWLEEIDAEECLSWVESQNARTLSRLVGPQYQTDTAALTRIYDNPDQIAFVTRRGDHLYNLWKDASNPRGLLRRTTLERYRLNDPQWETIFDLDACARKDNEDWTWQSSTFLPDDNDIALFRLSRGGGDAVILREFDLKTRTFVADGFTLEQAKGSATWLDRDQILLSSAFGEDMATQSGYAATVRLWKRGSPVEEAQIIARTARQNIAISSQFDRSAGNRRLWITEQIDFFNATYRFGPAEGPYQRLDLPTHCTIEARGDWLLVRPRKCWTVGSTTYEPDCVLGISLTAFAAGSRSFQRLFTPSPRRGLQGFFGLGDGFVLSYLEELEPRFDRLQPGSDGWSIEALAGPPKQGIAHIWPLDSDTAHSNGDLLMFAEDPLTPPSLSLLAEGKPSEQLRHAPSLFKTDGLMVSRHEAISTDGERIPYTQIGPSERSGPLPVHMSGYGGFGISVQATYNTSIGKLWLELGGISVIAHIRGGGEFGEAWHLAGRGAAKRQSHDDFAAIAADLISRGVTTPQQIAAEGGSNGGILICNMLTRYPHLFGALFCTIPLIDMRRYSQLLAGASWIAEYGDPDVAEDWKHLQHTSAYHTAKPGSDYPAIMIATTRRDDRVHPGHARKMAAKLQTMGYENSLYYELDAGGHSYGKDNAERAAFVALGFSFMRKAVGL